MTTPRISRRAVLGLTTGAATVGAAAIVAPRLFPDTPAPTLVTGSSPAVAVKEAARTTTGRTVSRTLRASPTQIDLGGRTVQTWAFDQALPGPEIRVTAGDRLKVEVTNSLPDPTTVHWHGLALRNDMDGVPGLTQASIPPSGAMTYDFVVPDPGTYWFHPHVGVQLDTGLYAPLIVEDPAEPGSYDDEVVLVLDDWTDGWSTSPDDILAGFRENGMASMTGSMADMSTGVSPTTPLGTDTGDVVYPGHLINGKLAESPTVVRSESGNRIRFRIINAGADTAYRFAIAGHRLTVTHADGFPVDPVEVDTLILGMGERYDVTVQVNDGTYDIVSEPEGKSDPPARAVLTTTPGRLDLPSYRRPAELDGRLLTYTDLIADAAVALPDRPVDRDLTMTLQMGDGGREWLINDRIYDDRSPLSVTPGQRVRIAMKNDSTMFHPMHLHGHTFALAGATSRGPRKDTVNVAPKSEQVVEFDAVNPGQWLAHCHNAYHGELGMMTVLSYVEPSS